MFLCEDSIYKKLQPYFTSFMLSADLQKLKHMNTIDQMRVLATISCFAL